MKQDITFSDSIGMSVVTSLFNATPTLDDIDLDSYPDPDGYLDGATDYVYDDDDRSRDDDIYEPDFEYNS